MAAEEELNTQTTTTTSIYKACRRIKRRENSIYNSLRSIYEDSIFVAEIAQLWPELPLLANLRCGLWYSSKFYSNCYFKSTDGHTNNLSFSTARLNLHVAELAGQRGGCIVVDSTRKGKRFPDSMSKTIPIWTCVLNRAIRNRLKRISGGSQIDDKLEGHDSMNGIHTSVNWDCCLYLPLWVSKTETAEIERHLEEWTEALENSGADIDCLVLSLKKPLRPMWVSPKTVVWLNEVPDIDSWDFTPIILVSASSQNGMLQQSAISEFSWNYIPGAGDDEESWARGLTPDLFWKNVFDLISCGPDLCNQKVSELVETNRVYRAQRGENAPQLKVKTNKLVECKHDTQEKNVLGAECRLLIQVSFSITKAPDPECSLYWIGSTNIAVGTSSRVEHLLKDVDAVLNCDTGLTSTSMDKDNYLHLPIVTSKLDRFSLLNHMPSAFDFAKLLLSRGKKLLICCWNGEDISVCVCLAILTSLFNEAGFFDSGKAFMESSITKQDLKRRLVFICKYSPSARPSRGNLKQVFSYLSSRQELATSLNSVIDIVALQKIDDSLS